MDLRFCGSYPALASHQSQSFGEPVMRALFPPIVIFSAIFLAPCGYGNTLQPGPTGPAPTEKSSGAASGSGGSGFFSMKGLGDAGGFAGGNKGSGFILSDTGGSSGPSNLGEGSKGPGDPVVSATPLPAAWTMMLIGLALGLLVWLRKSNFSAIRKRPGVA
jgi:hypothetical protein